MTIDTLQKKKVMKYNNFKGEGQMAFKKTVVLDFDGCIHSYTSGWKGVANIPDLPVDGIREAIIEMRKKYKVIIVSSRTSSYDGNQAIMEWLEKHDIEVDGLSDTKPPAFVYVDDRAIRFDGNSSNLLDQIDSFKTWQGK